jgi:mitochondrial fission protein ELM1
VTRDTSHPLVVWRFTDGKAGHDNQTKGLLSALRERMPVEDYTVHIADCRKGLVACLTGHDPFGKEFHDPDLLIGAGHATHLPMLNARRLRGGRIVVLMKPTLPVAWFDLCIIPAHDHPRHTDHVLVTQGVLNRISPASGQDPQRGLLLIGGPSEHVAWQDGPVIDQLREIVQRDPEVHWQLATSRRTPDSFVRALASQPQENLVIVPAAQTDADWLPQELAQAARVWVTEDSVSMVYEALTSGAAVGLINVPWHKLRHRLARGIAELVEDRLVTHIADRRAGRVLQPPARTFNEAARCAGWIAEHWLSAN